MVERENVFIWFVRGKRNILLAKGSVEILLPLSNSQNYNEAHVQIERTRIKI